MIAMTSVVFGVFEYSRLLMDWDLLNNAAREGCRYALANNTNPSISANVQSTVTNFMAGRTASFSSFTVNVAGTHQGVSTAVNSLAPGDLITVSVSGNYQFLNIIPLIRMPTAFTISSSITMICEGGT
jgi:Flp pilus assembly protein TadG